MRINRMIAKKVDLLEFSEPPKQNSFKRRKEPQNYILDYILVGSMVLFSILFIVYFVAVFIL